MSEILPPLLVDVKVSKNVHIMVKSRIAKIYVDKQVFVVKNNFLSWILQQNSMMFFICYNFVT
jgi:hypothetical protein